VSWECTTYFGAITEEVKRWSEPLYRAFLAGCGCVVWTGTCVYWVSKPKLFKEQPRRLHRSDGPAYVGDDMDMYFWHGVLVDEHVVMRPGEITLTEIASESNAEVRRVLIERYGPGRYVLDSGLTPVASDDWGTLYRSEKDGLNLCVLKVINATPERDGTYRDYFLRCNPTLYGGRAGMEPRAAVASTWRKPDGSLAFDQPEDYDPCLQT
jgi:hypothetical protein